MDKPHRVSNAAGVSVSELKNVGQRKIACMQKLAAANNTHCSLGKYRVRPVAERIALTENEIDSSSNNACKTSIAVAGKPNR